MAGKRVKGWMTGMRGVYLVAAELAKRGFIVSPTSRSARGADLLVTDQWCTHAWSVQVKTNSKPTGFWLLNKDAGDINSDSHIYVFVNLKANDERLEFFVVPGPTVVRVMRKDTARTGSVWYSFNKTDVPDCNEAWGLFDGSGTQITGGNVS
jgi:hypothetical protein